MKKIILLSILSCFAANSFAQPVLTWVRPPFGTTKTYNIYSGSLTEPTIGANQTWNYSSITPNNFGAGVYTNPTTLPASVMTTFPTSTYVEVWTQPAPPTIQQAVIDYYYDCSDSLVSLGQQHSGGGSYTYRGGTDGIWNLAFGASANGRYQDPSTGQLVTGSFTYAGYGTLITPFGTYNNVVMISRPGARTFFTTTPYFGMLMNILYSSPTTIAGAYIYSYGGATGIDDFTTAQNVGIYPNPVSNELYIDFRILSTNKIEILNALGTIVITETTNSLTTKINTSSLSKGVYFVRTTEKENQIIIKKFIKN